MAPPTEVFTAESLKIFVVEDNIHTLKYLRMYLEMQGHTVQSARNIAEATTAIPDSHCDVLISDINLPDGDAWEMLDSLDGKVPPYAIAVSGLGMHNDRARSRAVGFRHHLLKPFMLTDLDPMLAEASRERGEHEH